MARLDIRIDHFLAKENDSLIFLKNCIMYFSSLNLFLSHSFSVSNRNLQLAQR